MNPISVKNVVEQTDNERKEILRAFRELQKLCASSMREGDDVIIKKAFDVADKAHSGMRRKSGEPYILHPIAVAQIVAEEIGMGTTSVVCALLHDVVEDTEITLDDIGKMFNKTAAKIIDGLTKIKHINNLTDKSKSPIVQQAENLRKILLTLSDDVRVILVKLADRLHNMRTLKSMPPHKRIRISSETLSIYAPLAHRLGLYAIKTELEDLGLKYTKPEVYQDIAKKLAQTKRDRDSFIKEFIDPLKKIFKEKGIENFKIYGRSKSIHSIWNKIRKKNVEFEDIYDLFAIRLVVDVPREKEKEVCWQAYSIVSDMYRPIVERLRDWVSNPKSNGYESLHTTVMGPDGRLVEVQVRSKRMDEIAERGLAAHWKYKGGRSNGGALDQWLEKVRDVLSNPNSDAVDFMNDFKHNLYDKDLYVFTPNGDLKTMRGGATVLDFAYEIHTAIGKQCIGAKINNKLHPISHKLNNGDQVEIITSKKQKPNKDWLDFAKTSKARTSIKSHLKDEKRKVAEDGRAMFDRKMRSLKTTTTKEMIENLVHYFKQDDVLNFFYNVATKQFDLAQLKDITFVKGKIQNIHEKKVETPIDHEVSLGVNADIDLTLFGGFDKIDYTISPCCKPKPGDSVFGFITISNGIKIHRTACPNAMDMKTKFPYRIIKTKWTSDSANVAFLTGIRITGIDEVGLVNRITNIISDKMNVNMRSIAFDTVDTVFEGNITVFVNSTKELKLLMNELEKVPGVHKVRKYEA